MRNSEFGTEIDSESGLGPEAEPVVNREEEDNLSNLIAVDADEAELTMDRGEEANPRNLIGVAAEVAELSVECL